MTKFKTPKEMSLLMEKLNKGEITWDDVPEELEKIRKEQVKPTIRK